MRSRNTAFAVDTIRARQPARSEQRAGEAALGPYLFLRDAYLQRRERQVYDDNPPKSKDDLEEEEETKPPAN